MILYCYYVDLQFPHNQVNSPEKFTQAHIFQYKILFSGNKLKRSWTLNYYISNNVIDFETDS